MLKNVAGDYRHTALHWAALHGHSEVVREMLKLRAASDHQDVEGFVPIFLAAFSGHINIVEQLAEHGLGLGNLDPKGARVLQWASTQGHIALVEWLLSRTHSNSAAELVDARARDFQGGGSISAAANMGHASIVDLLQTHGADLDEADVEDMRPLHWASLHGHLEVVGLLLERRAKADAKTRRGQLPLHAAKAGGHTAVVQMLQKARKRAQRRGPRRRHHKRVTKDSQEL